MFTYESQIMYSIDRNGRDTGTDQILCVTLKELIEAVTSLTERVN